MKLKLLFSLLIIGCLNCILISISVAQQLAAGSAQSLFVCSDSTLRIWGDNASGQFGTGTIATSNIPLSFGNSNDITAVSEGYWHVLFPNIEIPIPTSVSLIDEGHFSNLTTDPVFPGRSTNLNIELKGLITKEEGKEYKLYYFFSTAYGMYPSSLNA